MPQTTNSVRPISFATRLKLSWRVLRHKSLTSADKFIFDELASDDIAIDCGANVGLITSLMAAKGAKVYAFEPDPTAYEILRKKFDGAASVQCLPKAVSTKAGKMKLFYRKERDQDPVKYSAGSSLKADKANVNLDTFSDVDVVSLAEFIRQFPRVRILKIDIEGAECEVLEDLIEHGLFDRIDLTLVETHEKDIQGLAKRLDKIKEAIKSQKIKNVYLNWI